MDNKPEEKYKTHTFPKRGKYHLRKGRYSLNRSCYFITTTTYKRCPILANSGICRILFNSLSHLEEEGRIKAICSIVMPDHIHVVFQLMEGQNLPKVMQDFKRFTAHKINKIMNRKGSVWQEQYYDHNIRSYENLEEIIKYCHENPVRKGLVERPEDWEFWFFKEKNL
ncbi:MAG: transposase [Candidatus Eremiobacteraeota bacterium]|nr:transposase [Candidatus Eremiobacteraeota bacterium]